MAVLGARHWYRYDSDNGKSYRIRTLDYLAEAAGLELDDTLPELPRSHKPRYVWVQEAESSRPGSPIRKKLIIQKKDYPRFKAGSLVEVAGIKMIAKSYFGECWRGGRGNDNITTNVRVEISKEE
ncbi:MAG: hypothetical protein DKT66_14100 [Candidatus Melainabacteria bacterium]|nr:MAG: hypothetical protein DKT66_14100 [Candidatus Melainabacteria bacterium]